MSTWTDHRPPTVEQCRQNGWGPGTRLVGDEGHGPTVIEITAVGEQFILAKAISHNGHQFARQWETNWTLELRDWTGWTDGEDEIIDCWKRAFYRDTTGETWPPFGQHNADAYERRARAALAALPDPVRAALLDAWCEHRDEARTA